MKMKFYQALALGIEHALEQDPRVVLFGSGFGGLSPEAIQSFAPMLETFADRVMVTPISELGLAGAAVGASLAGSRPLVDLSTGSFLLQALPAVLNEAANIHYMTGGQSRVPATFYSLIGIRGAGAAQHSHRPQAWVANTPGLQILMPSTPADAYGFIKWALLESQNPTCFFAHALLLGQEGDVDTESPMLSVGKAAVVRTGNDVTVIATSVMVHRSLEAAEVVYKRSGISTEVVDLRSLSPLDRGTVLDSVAKTGHAVIAEESSKSFGPGSELAAMLVEEGFPYLKGPVYRLGSADVPIPFSPPLETEVTPTTEKLVETIFQAANGAR